MTASLKKKILILNGSHSEVPLILASKKLGLHVITTGNEPSLIGHRYADEYHEEDYSDIHAIRGLAEQLDIDFICSCANDFGTITASFVAEKLGLPGQDSYRNALILHHKDKFKQLALQLEIPTPFAQSFSSVRIATQAKTKFRYPVIIKPVDLTGGKGILTAYSGIEYQQAIEHALSLSREHRIVVEEFFEGSLHSFSSFVVNQKVVFSFSDNEYAYKNPYAVATSCAPATDIEKYSNTLVESIERIVTHLDLRDGIFHIQFLANGQEATIVDITRRCSGDLYPYPVSYSTHEDWAYWIVKSEIGADCSTFPAVEQTGFCGRHCVMSDRDGIIKDVHISEEIQPHIFDQLWWWNPGDIIDNYRDHKVGVIFLKYDSVEQMHSICSKLPDYFKIELYPSEDKHDDKKT